MKNKSTLILKFSELDFSYDPTGSWKKRWTNLDRDFLWSSLCEFLKNSNAKGYEYCIFGERFIKKPSDVMLCLDNGEFTTFIVSVIERGRRQDISIHNNERLALADFLFRTLDDEPFKYTDISQMIRRTPR